MPPQVNRVDLLPMKSARLSKLMYRTAAEQEYAKGPI